MHTHSLFTLLGERLLQHAVTLTTYNTLYEVRAVRLATYNPLILEADGTFSVLPKRPVLVRFRQW